MNYVAFGEILINGITSEEVEKHYLFLDNRLKYIHSRNYYVENIGFNSIVTDEDHTLTFLGIEKIPDILNKDIYVKKNIEDLAKTILGAYVYNNSVESGLATSISFVDYVEISKRDPNYMNNNYYIMEAAIPNSEEVKNYFRKVLFDGGTEYYNSYVTRVNGSNKKSNEKGLVKATNVGKLTNIDREKISAFAHTLTYPVITIAIILFAIIFSLLYSYLFRG